MAVGRVFAGGAGVELGAGQAVGVAVAGELCGVLVGRFGCRVGGCTVGSVVACFSCCLGFLSFFFGCYEEYSRLDEGLVVQRFSIPFFDGIGVVACLFHYLDYNEDSGKVADWSSVGQGGLTAFDPVEYGFQGLAFVPWRFDFFIVGYDVLVSQCSVVVSEVFDEGDAFNFGVACDRVVQFFVVIFFDGFH